MVRETVGGSSGEAEEAPGQRLADALAGGRAARITHWWRCREACVPRASHYTVTAAPWQWSDEGVFMVPALEWLEMREQAAVFLFHGERGQRFRCLTRVMKEQGRVVERDGLMWVVPLEFLEQEPWVC